MRKPNRTWTSSLMLLVFLAGYPVAADATVFVPLSVERLTLLSTHAVTAKCTHVESRWTEDRASIYTRVEFEVQKRLRGELSSEKIALYLPGGTVGDQSVIVIGAPEIKVGEELVLMLKKVQPGTAGLNLRSGEEAFGVVGLSQGVFELRRDSEATEARAVSRAVPIFTQQQARLDQQPPGGVSGMPLAELENTIREISLREARTQEGQEKEGQAEEGEGPEGQEEEGEAQESTARRPAPPPRGLEAQEREGREESGAGPGDAPEETREVDPEEQRRGRLEEGEEEPAPETTRRQAGQPREGQEVEGEEEKGEGGEGQESPAGR